MRLVNNVAIVTGAAVPCGRMGTAVGPTGIAVFLAPSDSGCVVARPSTSTAVNE